MTQPELRFTITGIPDYTDKLDRLEQLMATAAEQINALTGKIDGLTAVATDIAADFAALIAAMNADRENLSETGQAALDAANARADAAAAKLAELDAAVGDADGSDTPPEEPSPTE